MEEKSRRGGRRPNAGRPSNGRNIAITVRISREAMDILDKEDNKSRYIDELIKNTPGSHDRGVDCKKDD